MQHLDDNGNSFVLDVLLMSLTIAIMLFISFWSSYNDLERRYHSLGKKYHVLQQDHEMVLQNLERKTCQ